uniref:RNase III domain-containing protein n=1 Tax=Macrostomum lignano TaxID=282301 RepID=A0A1I8JPZ4_9PLAT
SACYCTNPGLHGGGLTQLRSRQADKRPQKRNKKRSGARNRGKGKSAGSRRGCRPVVSSRRSRQQQQQQQQQMLQGAAGRPPLQLPSLRPARLPLVRPSQSASSEATPATIRGLANAARSLLPSAVRDFGVNRSRTGSPANRIRRIRIVDWLIDFRNRAYLLQAFTHPYLFHDSRRHSPAVLTDLRSALVNNDIFGALAVKWGFHKYFRCVSPALCTRSLTSFVQFQKDDKADNLDFVTSEVRSRSGLRRPARRRRKSPNASGDIFESVAGAVFLDSGMSLDTVWRVFYPPYEGRSSAIQPKYPSRCVRELLRD